MVRFVLNEIPLILIQSTYSKRKGKKKKEKRKNHVSMIVQKANRLYWSMSGYVCKTWRRNTGARGAPHILSPYPIRSPLLSSFANPLAGLVRWSWVAFPAVGSPYSRNGAAAARTIAWIGLQLPSHQDAVSNQAQWLSLWLQLTNLWTIQDLFPAW